jgi:hypothetical protein
MEESPMNVLMLFVLLQQPEPAPSQIVREHADRALKAEDLEVANVLYAIARFLEPGEAIQQLDLATAKKLREATALKRATLDLSALTNSPWDGLVQKAPVKTKGQRGKRSQLILNFDGEQINLKSSSVIRKRVKPGALETERFILVTEDEILRIDGKSLEVIEPVVPGALAGKLLKAADARTQVAGMMLYSVRNVIRGMQRINDCRKAAGVAPVSFSADSSHGAFLHARYLVNEDPALTAGLAAHQEVETSTWRTPEGAAAGLKSVLASFGLEAGVDQLMATLYHRIPLIAPDLVSVGIGQWDKDLQFYTVINIRDGRAAKAPAPAVMYPGDGQTNVPRTFASGEVPDPRPVGIQENVGYPITLSNYGGGEATAELKTEKGDVVECTVSTPKAPANPGAPDNSGSVCLLPKKALREKTKYLVTVKAGDKTWNWAFTTK